MLQGPKIFYFIEPTSTNLQKYEWTFLVTSWYPGGRKKFLIHMLVGGPVILNSQRSGVHHFSYTTSVDEDRDCLEQSSSC